MKHKPKAFGLALLFVINITALATFAYNRWVKTQDRSLSASDGGSAAAIPVQLSLSQGQATCVRALRSSYQAGCQTYQAQMQEKRKALVQEIRKEAADMATINQLIEDISRLQAEMQKKAVLSLFKEKEVLTPEQREMYFRLFEDHVCSREKDHAHGRRGSEKTVSSPDEDCLNSH